MPWGRRRPAFAEGGTPSFPGGRVQKKSEAGIKPASLQRKLRFGLRDVDVVDDQHVAFEQVFIHEV